MPAKIAIVATVSVAVVFSVLLKRYYMYENRRRDIQAEGHGPENSDFFGSDGQGESGRLRYSMF